MLDQVHIVLSTLTVFKAALACWFALVINMLAGRFSTICCIGAMLASVLAGVVAAQLELTTRGPVWAFLSAAFIAGGALYASLRVAASAQTDSDERRRSFVEWLGILAILLGTCIAAVALFQLVPNDERIWAGPKLLTICNCLGLAAALVAAVELTFGQSDASVADDHGGSKRLLRTALAATLIGVVGPSVAAIGLVSGDYPASQLDGQVMREEFRLLAWLYVGMSITVYAVVAVGLQQLLQRRSSLRPRQVATTIISMWLAAAGLIVIVGMPHNWPWLVRAESDALVGEMFEE